MRSVEQIDVIRFIKEQIIHRFGIPESITTDKGLVFTGSQVEAFANEYKFKLLSSTPYYAQANGQAESTNKIWKSIIRKMIDDNPRDWHNLLSEVLWAHRITSKDSTGASPYALTFGHDAVIPMEVVVPCLRIAYQNQLTPAELTEAMLLELEGLDEMRLQALNALQVAKARV